MIYIKCLVEFLKFKAKYHMAATCIITTVVIIYLGLFSFPLSNSSLLFYWLYILSSFP